MKAKKSFFEKVKKHLIFIITAIIIVFIYDRLMYSITEHTYTRARLSVYLLEIPLMVMLTLIFYFKDIKSKIFRLIFPTIPLISIYLCLDLFYSFLLRTPKFSDFENFITIYYFDPLMFFMIVLFIVIVLFLIGILIKEAKKTYTLKKYILTLIIRFFLIIFIIFFLQTNIFKNYHQKIFKHKNSSQKSTIKNNGKISSFIYYSKIELENKEKLGLQKTNHISISNELYKGELKVKQNIYIVVLESFINPNYLENVHFDKNPLSNELQPYLSKNKFSKVISPIYGGNTPQAEFEILTGIKAFAKINTTEFNVLEGGKIDGFVNQLKKNDYNTFATIATNSRYYNSNTAYKSLGFDKIIFLEEDRKFKKNRNDKQIFDGNLFDYSIEFIKNYLKTTNKPLFNYILGSYGHKNYYRNKKDRPDVINITNLENKKLKNITNQFYYRTQALAKYIKKIINLDPNALIFISSDHLPPILGKNIKYKYNRHINIALLINKGQTINFDKQGQYKIPWLLWDILSSNTTKRNDNITNLETIYYKALQESLEK